MERKIDQYEIEARREKEQSDVARARAHISRYKKMLPYVRQLENDIEVLTSKIEKSTQMPRGMVVQSNPLMTIDDLILRLTDLRGQYEKEWAVAESVCNAIEIIINRIPEVKGQEMDKKVLKKHYIAEKKLYEIAGEEKYSDSSIDLFVRRGLLKYAKVMNL